MRLAAPFLKQDLKKALVSLKSYFPNGFVYASIFNLTGALYIGHQYIFGHLYIGAAQLLSG